MRKLEVTISFLFLGHPKVKWVKLEQLKDCPNWHELMMLPLGSHYVLIFPSTYNPFFCPDTVGTKRNEETYFSFMTTENIPQGRFLVKYHKIGTGEEPEGQDQGFLQYSA